MPGPLAALYALLGKENEGAYQDVHGRSPHISREMFNSRLSPVFEQMQRGKSGYPDPRAESPVVIGDDGRPMLIPADFPTLGYNDMQPGQGPMPFRDPGQGGPMPPAHDSFASMYRGRR